MDFEKNKVQRKMSAAYVGGMKIEGVKYRHNSVVMVSMRDGQKKRGWIVGVEIVSPEPIYTIELEKDHPCFEINESALELILDPHDS